jgi:hypothetical protein
MILDSIKIGALSWALIHCFGLVKKKKKAFNEYLSLFSSTHFYLLHIVPIRIVDHNENLTQKAFAYNSKFTNQMLNFAEAQRNARVNDKTEDPQQIN